MNKKNILTAAVSLSLVACLSIGATLAYFTDKTDVKNNAFTTGNVDITLTDTSDSDKATEVETGIVYDDVLPGDNLDKNVYVTVDKDSSAAYVGVFVSVDYNHFGRPDSYDVMGLVYDAMMRQGTMNNWNEYYVNVGSTDGVLYVYNQVVDPDGTEDVVLDLFSDIQIPTTWDNNFAGAQFGINVQAFATQAENFSEGQFIEMVDGTLTDANGNVIEFQEFGNK
ncbi:SipW-dependent-type signal peptide-containing protein [Gemmiger sp. An194]|uniref:SipW-dependent-type signal peptide-containing protein n=1 Tax=Gemmiger sp. An194 TaxID=1965582 RepID=UPI000B3887A4|nr:SipW-dependent-type signal peptide-containing protein [Gemmiger sp. An194]OUP25173.1 hypothetical protein B5F28_02510 [Gemmiger sp. An194]